jgi:16S rRNA (guanine527-N7)-methyltransferase
LSDERFREVVELAGPVSRETFDRLCAFEKAFLKWAGQINLVSAASLPTTWRRHILDSIQLLPLAPQALRWADFGSGGGFPGLPLAILLMERNGASIDLVESNRKKAGFLQAMIGQFDLPARVHAVRIEDAVGKIETPDIVTARALAPLSDLLRLSEPWLSTTSKSLFHKGRDFHSELLESSLSWGFDLVEHRSNSDDEGVILEVSKLRRLF